jgi:glycosyltransferase involved in cell wall biosynthesis
MSNDLPYFSVVMATHQRPQLLRRALASLRAQSCQDFEALVVADDGDPETARVAAEMLGPRDSFLRRSGVPGPALSRNRGLQAARGQWLLFLDDDDTFAPHHLETVRAQAADPAAMVLFSDCEVVTEDRSVEGLAPLTRQALSLTGNDVEALWVRNFVPNHALAYRQAAILDRAFDPHMASLEDWDFLLSVCSRHRPRAFAGGGAVMHKDYVNAGTRRGTQASSNNSLVILDFLYVYRRWPAPTPQLRAQRQALIAGVGLNLPLDWF